MKRLTRATIASTGFVVVWTSLAFGASPPVVYHSPTMDGVNPGTPHVLDEYDETLDLYFSPGANPTTTGEICLDGDGDEVCGITIVLQASGDVTFSSFTEEVTSDLVVNFSPPSSLTINRLNGTSGDAVAVRLGSLDVNVGTTGGDIGVATTSEAVGAALQTLAVADNGTLAAPEPRLIGSIVAGVTMLAAAGRYRRNRREGGPVHVPEELPSRSQRGPRWSR